ncbi:LOW QUALITY PROTEIN: interleukin-4 receptor subunit alpha [Tenrec ecaudatus]|uniref:LOW QUALITY PROTEIN: interleukin-4 receptor subunit alpha n=1 Tax=Tenrec ecaudatus TaxID=94439 RepID=UPI003F597491
MGWLCSGVIFPVSCLILVWVVSSGSMKVLQKPTCFSNYISTSTCEWEMELPTNCSAGLLLSYQLQRFLFHESGSCVPQNKEEAQCVCTLLMNSPDFYDKYSLQLSAGPQLLWEDFFQPSQHIIPRAPENLTVEKNVSDRLHFTWSNPYAPEDNLYSELTYLVNISNENDPSDFTVQEVNYTGSFLMLPAKTLKNGVRYRARVKTRALDYGSSWSEWSNSCTWYNYYQEDILKRHLLLGVSISCVLILAVSVSCYFLILKIKKEWWDQIPNPAHSPLVAIIIQDTQMPLWGKPFRSQKPSKSPRWKTCLTKLLPCLLEPLEPAKEREESLSKAAQHGPLQGLGKSAWCADLSRTVLWPESISVVQRVELLEAQVADKEEEEEEEEDDKESLCPSPDSSALSFHEGRAGIAARLTESLFLDLLGCQEGTFSPQGSGDSPPGSRATQAPWVPLPGTEPEPAALQGTGPELASLPLAEVPAVVADNPAYRSLSTLLSPSPGPGAPASDPPLAESLVEADAQGPSTPEPSEQPGSLQPETWEEILRQRVLQHGAAPDPSPAGGYRDWTSAVGQQGAQLGQTAACSPAAGETGYKAFSSLLPSASAPGVEASSGAGGYKPFQNLLPGGPETSVPVGIPLFTFGLDIESPLSPQGTLCPSSSPEHLGLEPVGKGGDSQKPPLSPEQPGDSLRDDLGSGIVYSTLTCHLCGHLKQRHGQEERGQPQAVASPCCDCRCCEDKSSPPVSPQRAPEPPSKGLPWEAGLSSASPAPLGVSKEGLSLLAFQAALNHAQSSHQSPKVAAIGPYA